MKRQFIWRYSHFHKLYYAEVIICNPKTRDCIMQKLINNAYDEISALVFLAIPVVFQ